MSNNDDRDTWRRLMSVCGLALAWAACTPDYTGSGCVKGVCANALASEAPVCLASSIGTEIGFSEPPPQDDRGLTEVCWPRPLPRDEHGKVQCRITWELPPAAHCSDYPFLATRPVSFGPRGGPTCLLPEVEPPASGIGTEEGWFYASDVGKPDCDAAIYFTRQAAYGVSPQAEGVYVVVTCRSLDTVLSDGSVVALDESLCTLPDRAQRASSVGASCVPAIVPDEGGGFLEENAYVETNAPDCQTGVCLVFHLQGDPTPGCSETTDDSRDAGAPCASQEEIDRRVYCSCRCDSYGGYHGCDCPYGFLCVQTADHGVAGGREKYCVNTALAN